MLYLFKRLMQGILVLFGVTLFVFLALRLTGDPAAALLHEANPTVEAIEALRRELGLDKPLWLQFLDMVKGLLTGDLGVSFRSKMPVMPLIASRIPATLILAFAGIVVSTVISVPLGVLSAVRRGSLTDLAGRFFSLLGVSFPNFWLAIMLILIFSVRLKWLPASGYLGGRYLVLPALSLGLILAATQGRLLRASMLDVLNQQYIQTARAKGLGERVVIFKHALRNSLLSVVTYAGVQIGSLLGGTVVIEQVFSWPGIGRLAFDALNARDYPIVQGIVLILASMLVVTNLIIDLSYGVLDPRIRLDRGAT